jgi:peptidoglycan/xylan/chitin deacetylase (PgdA/CDA1 family)
MIRRIVVLLAALALPSVVGAATYYIDATNGVDAQSGLTPALAWKTLGKLPIVGLAQDDVVLLKRGEVWAEQLIAPNTGTAGHPITFGAYGYGAPPRILGGTRACYFASKNYITFNNLVFEKEFRIDTSVGIIVNNCVVKNSNLAGMYFNGTEATVNNSVIAGNLQHGILATGAVAVVVKNSIVVGNGGISDATAYYGLSVSGGATITYSYCIVTGNSVRGSRNVQATVTDGGNNRLEVYPGQASAINGTVRFVLSVDDSDTVYATDLAALVAARGGRLTLFAAYPQTWDAPSLARTVALSAAGHEVALHGWSHSDLTKTDALSLTSTNTLPTVDVDVATSQLILSCTEVGNRVTVDWSATGKSIANLRTAVAGKGWTVTNGTSINDLLQLSSLADTAGALSVPRTLTLDVSAPNYAFWRDEILDTVAWMTANLGVTPATMSFPFGATSAALITYVKDTAGLIGARNSDNWLQRFDSVPIYKIASPDKGAEFLLGDGTEASIRERTRHYVELCRQLGAVFSLFVHTTADMTVEQVGWVVDEAFKGDTIFQTFGAIMAAIRSDHSTADGLTYTKTYPDVSNFRLIAGSTAVNAGVAVAGLTTDIMGSPLQNLPDIGAYELNCSEMHIGPDQSLIHYYVPGCASYALGSY